MNLIFLDIDGVLNSPTYLKEYCQKTNTKGYYGENYPFDNNCLKRLKLIVDCSNSQIVITSAWRKNSKQLTKILEI